MGRFPKPCADCGVLTSGGNRCDYHENLVKKLHDIKRAEVKKNSGQYSGSYKARAAAVRASALLCWLCGEGARAGDPWEADHVIPAESGSTAELRAAHRTCNRKRSNLV
jgi:5-methylcytosine-specific restriction endonuclease McrA